MMIRNHCYCFSVIVTIYFCLLIRTLASPSPYTCHHDERDALLEFRDEFPIFKSNSSSWNKSIDCCLWGGIMCNYKTGQVILLDLRNTFLNNSLKTNSSLFRLQYLSGLCITGCNLQGEIPSSIGNLSCLTSLDLSMNNLIGEIPVSIGNLNQLSIMILPENSLSGNIPISFANLTKLLILKLYSNNLSTLPSDMSRLPNLEYFDVGDNSFHGPFPKFLFLIPSLQILGLEGNQVTGPIEFANTSSSSSTLQYLYNGRNKFNGPIPESITEFPNLYHLHLSANP